MNKSITTELRGGLEKVYGGVYTDMEHVDYDKLTLDRLCDAIDAVHANLERENESLRRELDRVLGESDSQGDSMHDGWVRLPVDEDGVRIHIGDVMDGTCPSGKHVNGIVSAIGDGVFWLSNVQFSLKPDYMHHYHAPTVEDVLREFARECLTYATCVDDHEVQDAIAEYAEKLRLAEGDTE